MKSKTNGAAPPVAEIKMSPIGRQITNERQAREVAKVEPEKRAKVVEAAAEKAASKRRCDATKTLTVVVSADSYGFLCAAGVVHENTPEEMAGAFIDDTISAWANEDYRLDHVTFEPAEG